MNNSFFQDTIDIITLTVLITLSIYHFIIYWHRKKYTEEHYNLYFSFFTFLIALYLFFETPMFVLKIVFNKIYGDWIPPIEAIIVLGIFLNFTRFFSKMINFPEDREKYLKYGLHFLAVSLSLTLLSFLKGWDWANRNVVDIVIGSVTIYILFISYLYGKWIIENKLFNNRNFKLIVVGLCILVFFLLGIKMTEIIFYPLTFRGNNFVMIGVVFLFAYALAEKFSMEFKELGLLKNNLEQKITERTAELTSAKEEIEVINKERSDFFINLAHETKTPLTIISNYLDKYISKNGLSEEIGVIKRNIDKLCKDMVDFLEMEKLIKGKFDFQNNEVISFSELLNEKISLFREYAKNKSIQFSTEIKSDLYIKADPYLADRIIFNLVENAIKYTSSGGGVTVGLKCENNEILFIVSDTGIGISETKLPHIFEPYYQASHKKLNSQGIGMGLYIVKSSVELLNGSISVESTVDKGTKFTILLPLHMPKINEKITAVPYLKQIISESKIIEKDFEAQKKSILLIEDNIDMLNYLIEELSSEYNTFPARNGIEAISKINNIANLSLIISDIMMDKMDGEELYNKIINNDSFKNIPFVFLTAKTQQEDKIKMLESGVIDYIYKPFSIVELKARIKTIIENTEKQKKEGLKQAIELISKQVNNPGQIIPDKNIIFEERCNKYDLTSRQKEIVILVAEGLEYKEIADRLNISPKTILNHINILFKKLDVHNKVDLINKLYR